MERNDLHASPSPAAILSDLDGVLVDSAAGAAEVADSVEELLGLQAEL